MDDVLCDSFFDGCGVDRRCGRQSRLIIEGEFNAHATPGCWAPKSRIIASKIQLISPVEDTSSPLGPDNGSSLRVKH